MFDPVLSPYGLNLSVDSGSRVAPDMVHHCCPLFNRTEVVMIGCTMCHSIEFLLIFLHLKSYQNTVGHTGVWRWCMHLFPIFEESDVLQLKCIRSPFLILWDFEVHT